MTPRFSAPYYVVGKQHARWHTNQAERAGTYAAGAALGAAALHHATSRSHILGAAASGGYHIHPDHAKAFGTALGFAAAGAGAYAGFHAYRSHQINKGLRGQRGKKKRVG